MLDHLGIQVADVDASAAFYLAVFAPLDYAEIVRYPAGTSSVVGIGVAGDRPRFWIGPAERSEARELHIAFDAGDRAAVEAVYQAALEAAGVARVPRGLLRGVSPRPRRPQRRSRLPRGT
jgi:catechol 2,3-dioxygenase-like lactoylglutathione lyase family enzyme